MAVLVKHSKKTTRKYWGRVEKLLDLPEHCVYMLLKSDASLQVKKKLKMRGASCSWSRG